MTHDLLQIKPCEIPRPIKHGKTYYAKGDFLYFHYCCDNYIDVVSLNIVKKYVIWLKLNKIWLKLNKISFILLLLLLFFHSNEIKIGMGLRISYIAIDVLMDYKESLQHNK